MIPCAGAQRDRSVRRGNVGDARANGRFGGTCDNGGRAHSLLYLVLSHGVPGEMRLLRSEVDATDGVRALFLSLPHCPRLVPSLWRRCVHEHDRSDGRVEARTSRDHHVRASQSGSKTRAEASRADPELTRRPSCKLL